MRVAFAALVLSALVSGCAGAGTGGNPNLLAPKLVVQPRDDGNVTLFVHGAFRDVIYDWISLSVDNATLANRTQVFSIEEAVPAQGFFVSVRAGENGQLYEARARLDMNATADRLLVATLDDAGWHDARTQSLPYELVLDRPQVSS